MNRYVIFPIQHHRFWSLYKKLVSRFWTFDDNINEESALHYISLRIVNNNTAERICALVQIQEVKFFAGHQMFVQNLHYEYLSKICSNQPDDLRLQWLNRFDKDDIKSVIIANICLNGIFFSALDLCKDNSFLINNIILDREIFTEFACSLYNHFQLSGIETAIQEASCIEKYYLSNIDNTFISNKINVIYNYLN